jgi:hypothetical protein
MLRDNYTVFLTTELHCKKMVVLGIVKWFSKRKFYWIQIFFEKKSVSNKICVY